jgi:hypothetical protein
MRVREYSPADLTALRAMHASQHFEYPFPDIERPEFFAKYVLEDDAAQPVMAALARMTCEVYLLLDPSAGTPRERYGRLLALHRIAERDLYARGLSDAHAWLPPRISLRFGRRLEQLGWTRDVTWTPYSKRLAV